MSTVTVRYSHAPFHGQVYGVGLVETNSSLTLDGGKYQLPSILIRSSTGASAMTVSPTTAFMRLPIGCGCRASAPEAMRSPARAGRKRTPPVETDLSPRDRWFAPPVSRRRVDLVGTVLAGTVPHRVVRRTGTACVRQRPSSSSSSAMSSRAVRDGCARPRRARSRRRSPRPAGPGSVRRSPRRPRPTAMSSAPRDSTSSSSSPSRTGTGTRPSPSRGRPRATRRAGRGRRRMNVADVGYCVGGTRLGCTT